MFDGQSIFLINFRILSILYYLIILYIKDEVDEYRLREYFENSYILFRE